MYHEINYCEVCGNRDLIAVLDLGDQPLCDDLVSLDSNRVCDEYPIEILLCQICLTAHQRFQVKRELLFPRHYHYRARMTGSVLQGMRDLVASCVSKYGSLENKLVLDVGCNDGSLLRIFSEYGCRVVGVEPTDAAKDSVHNVIQAYFDPAVASSIIDQYGSPDLICFTNVFAHISNLDSIITALNILKNRDTKVVIENHYLGAVLDYGQFDTFYHEHPRTYSVKSFGFIARRLGCVLSDVELVSRYGGNVRAYIESASHIDFLTPKEENVVERFGALNIGLLQWKYCTRKLIDDLVTKWGPLRAKAFPGRASILIKLLGLNADHISAVYEIKGSIKVNHFIPGTRIPILPEQVMYESSELNEAPILNLAWHLPAEVRANLKSNNFHNEVIDIKPFVPLNLEKLL